MKFDKSKLNIAILNLRLALISLRKIRENSDKNTKPIHKNNNNSGNSHINLQNEFLKEAGMPTTKHYQHNNKSVENLEKKHKHLNIKKHEPTIFANYNHFQGPQL